jgi:hypothetical protein
MSIQYYQYAYNIQYTIYKAWPVITYNMLLVHEIISPSWIHDPDPRTPGIKVHCVHKRHHVAVMALHVLRIAA